jgi:hypothetical protein
LFCYADDLVIACQRRDDAELALNILKECVTANGLELYPEKSEGVEPIINGGPMPNR